MSLGNHETWRPVLTRFQRPPSSHVRSQFMSTNTDSHDVTRRNFLQTSLASAAGMAIGADVLLAATDRDAVVAEIAKQHDVTVTMLRDWIALPSIAAENLNYP